MRKIVSVLAFIVFGWAAGAVAETASRGTAEEAQALVARAIATYDEVGAEAALAQLNTKDGEFVDRDLYVFVIAPDATTVAHGADPSHVGQKLVLSLVDAAGQPVGQRLLDSATPEGAWADYQYTDPLTGAEYPKRSWVVLHDGYIFGTGIYVVEP